MQWLDDIIKFKFDEFEQTPGDSGGREAWRAVMHGVTKSWTQPSD